MVKLSRATKSTEENLGRSLGNHLSKYSGITVFVVAVSLRGLVGWMLADNLDADPDAYAAIAHSIERSGVYGLVDDQGIARPTAFRPPLYPWLLSLLSVGDEGHRGSVLFLHALLGGWTVLATFLISRRYVRIFWSLLASALVMLDPILMMQSTLVMTETLATALSATVLLWCVTGQRICDRPPLPWERSSLGEGEGKWSVTCGWFQARFKCWPSRCASRAGFCAQTDGNKLQNDCVTAARKGEGMQPATLTWSIVLGLLLTLSYLCRPTFLVWAILLVVALAGVAAWRDRWNNWQLNLLPSAITIFIVAVGVGAWTTRNWNAIGHPVWATTHGGYTLLLGNNPMFYEHLQSAKPGEVWDAGPFLERYQNRYQGAAETITEYGDDRRAYEEAKSTIASQPRMFVYSCIVRLARLWSPMPHQIDGRSPVLKFGVGVFYVAVFCMSLIGLYKLRHRWFDRFVLASLTLALTLSLVHSVYWSNMRMRAPLAPAMAVLVAVGVVKHRGRSH